MNQYKRTTVRSEVASLVSGIPSLWRGRRLFVVLQVFADESFGNKYTILAGYIAQEKKREDFSDSWQSALELSPKLRYFKFREAISFSGQFGRFSKKQRDERFSVFVGVVKRFALAAIITAVSERAYKDVLKGKFLITHRSRRLDNPYCQAFFNFMLDAMSLIRREAIREKIDFIFDEHIFKGRVLAAYDHFKAAARDRELQYPGSPPIFRDDLTFLPLQAADLLSGYVNRRSLGRPYPEGLDELMEVPVVTDIWNRERMQTQLEVSNAILSKIRERPERTRERFMEIRDWIPPEYKKRMRVGLLYPQVGQLRDKG